LNNFAELDVTANNVTCQLFTKISSSYQLHFVYVDIEMLFQNSSIEILHKSGKLRNNKKEFHTIVHYRYLDYMHLWTVWKNNKK